MERDREREINDDKALDPYSALQKVMRLDRKHTNFDFRDFMLNKQIQVKYPTIPDTLSGEHLLKQYWRHAQNYYFKSITQNEIQRINYLQSLFNSLPQCDQTFKASQQFWRLLQDTIQPYYLRHYPTSQQSALDHQNWILTLYLNFKLFEESENISKKQLKQQLKSLEDIKIIKQKSLRDKMKNYKQLDVLKQQEKKLKGLLGNQKVKDNSQVTRQLNKLQKQLRQVNSQNKKIFGKMKNRIETQVNHRQFTYCLNQNQSSQTSSEEMLDYTALNTQVLHELDQIDIKIKYLKCLILNLDKKQVSQSITKITKVQKFKGQTKFWVEFEKAMNISPRLLPQKELNKLNSLRQYSLLKFYNTSIKSKFSFICQNFLGFREINNNRLQPCKYKESNMIQAMKDAKVQLKDPSIKAFTKFQICHHCKLLYPQYLLTECRYSSTKMGAPINPFPYFDSYVHQVIKNDQSNHPTRFSHCKRNPYNSYIKRDDQYVCQRKFCKYCLKQNYQQGIDKNGLCPFCQGICFCTRCSRNDMVSRLKSMYLLLGGDVNEINQESQLERLVYVYEPDALAQTKKKGRPKKNIPRKSQSHSGKYFEKLQTIRFSMEFCRGICDVVKRRQKTKSKLAQASSESFLKRLNCISSQYQCNKRGPKKSVSLKKNLNNNSKSLIQEQKEQTQLKNLKRLKRML